MTVVENMSWICDEEMKEFYEAASYKKLKQLRDGSIKSVREQLPTDLKSKFDYMLQLIKLTSDDEKYNAFYLGGKYKNK